MTNPGGVRIDPELLADVGDTLAATAVDIQQSLGMFTDPAMWTEPGVYAQDFGPAVDVANTYTELARKLPGYLAAVTARLNQGADAFRQAAAGYRAVDERNAGGVGKAAPAQPGGH